MNGKLENKLAQLAFGDLTPSEARQLEAEAERDPDARRALMLYKDMRDGLRNLQDVPEDQFSKERLRDAILTQGLRPPISRQTSNRSWLWMPVAACALGFSVMFMRHSFDQTSKQPELVLGSKSLSSPTLMSISPPTRVAVNDTHKVTHGPEVKAVHPLRIVSRSTSRHGVRHVREMDESSPDVLTYLMGPGEENVAPSNGAITASMPIPPVAEPTPSTATASSPIVLIDQDKDTQTGAQRATEVGSASNVLVGG